MSSYIEKDCRFARLAAIMEVCSRQGGCRDCKFRAECEKVFNAMIERVHDKSMSYREFLRFGKLLWDMMVRREGYVLVGNRLLSCNPLAPDNGSGALDGAVSLLNDLLGPVDARCIFSEADKRGISRSTLYRAKDKLNVHINVEGKKGGKRGRGKTTWELPR